LSEHWVDLVGSDKDIDILIAALGRIKARLREAEELAREQRQRELEATAAWQAEVREWRAFVAELEQENERLRVNNDTLEEAWGKVKHLRRENERLRRGKE
jgi:cell shape-determining protein MreC